MFSEENDLYAFGFACLTTLVVVFFLSIKGCQERMNTENTAVLRACLVHNSVESCSRLQEHR